MSTRKPMKTLKELAQDIGVTVQALKGGLCNSKRRGVELPSVFQPKPSAPCWYEPGEFRNWWEKYQDAEIC